jgi:hypothetical protein
MSSPLAPPTREPVGAATAVALVVAVLTVAGSLSLSLAENKVACPLCFYQRSFALGIVGLLGVGLLGRAAAAGRLAALALPLAVAGLGVAAFHVSLEERGILECPSGLLGLLTAPKQSAAAFAVLALLLLAEALGGLRRQTVGGLAVVLAVLLGAGMAWASTVANPKPPDPPTKPYDGPPMTCRRPYTGATP